ncbi:MAG: hypothetical protein PVJ57_13935 [Phycisphaerae bacterium]|jgi:hypothetical protein
MPAEDSFDAELLDFHLGHLTDTQRRACQHRIAADPKFAEQHEALTAVFRTLHALPKPAAPKDLAARIKARVAQTPPPLRVVRPQDDWSDVAAAADTGVIRLGNLREIISVAAMIVLMVGIGVPSLLNMRERNQRMGCSQNLARIGQGMQQYASTFGASLPFAGWGPQASWRPSDDPRVVTLPNRRHVYRLLRGYYVNDPRVFVCPAQGGSPMPKGEVGGHNDFIESGNVSYAYFNMAGVRPKLDDQPGLPIMADDNPIFEDGVPLFERLGLRDSMLRNSPAHNAAGQNVLMADGHFKWATTPNAGVNDDNIWTLQGVEVYSGREGPASPADAHLIK